MHSDWRNMRRDMSMQSWKTKGQTPTDAKGLDPGSTCSTALGAANARFGSATADSCLRALVLAARG